MSRGNTPPRFLHVRDASPRTPKTMSNLCPDMNKTHPLPLFGNRRFKDLESQNDATKWRPLIDANSGTTLTTGRSPSLPLKSPITPVAEKRAMPRPDDPRAKAETRLVQVTTETRTAQYQQIFLP
ncbi:unnamed protein product [Taenia asiatica]|uniref:Uncharacterized protein n=1 Tax=Taenia asiatica TaxID=60517 RepID=A0A0R3VW37_TAEAS|nr:unnamed protein product [Taenia asiatica]